MTTPLASDPPSDETDDGLDRFFESEGPLQAGRHLLLDLWGAAHLSDPEVVRAVLCEAALAAGATILHSHLHSFGGGGGVTGVVVLAESHISIHTWPEHAFAAIDIFMCGSCDPQRALPVLHRYFRPHRMVITEHRRGDIR